MDENLSSDGTMILAPDECAIVVGRDGGMSIFIAHGNDDALLPAAFDILANVAIRLGNPHFVADVVRAIGNYETQEV